MPWNIWLGGEYWLSVEEEDDDEGSDDKTLLMGFKWHSLVLDWGALGISLGCFFRWLNNPELFLKFFEHLSQWYFPIFPMIDKGLN